MKKWGLVLVIILAIVVIYLLFFQQEKEQTAPNVNSEVGYLDGTTIVDTPSETNNVEEQQKNEDNPLIQSGFQIYRFGDKVNFDELDDVEKVIAGFVSEFYFVKADETVEQLTSRIEPYFGPQAGNVNAYLDKEIFPAFGERKLKAIYLPPEYLEEKLIYVVPARIVYEMNNEEVDDFVYFGVIKKSDTYDNNYILGHVEKREWFLNELEVKYGQPNK